MSTWSSTTKRMVRVGYGQWVDPLSIQAVDTTPAGKIRLHLSGGASIDVMGDQKVTSIDERVERLMRGLMERAGDPA